MEIIRSSRRSVAIQVRPDGSLVVRAPYALPETEIRAAVERHRGWIERTRRHLALQQTAPTLTQQELRQLIAQAKAALPPLVSGWAGRLGVRCTAIGVRSPRTRWGSCSSRGSLSFNCLLMLCPPEVLEYVVVHELCHRKHMDHSPAFWAEVERALPQYRVQRDWLKQHGPAILRRLPEKSGG